MTPRIMLILAAILGGLAVAAGAFGAHAFSARFTPASDASPEAARSVLRLKDNYEVAARYQMYHALALAITGLVALRHPHPTFTIAAFCFLFGTIIFSGLLYAIALGGPKILGAIVPFGGTALIV
ncbi:MAG: DUF423 domain-containing protein, partial [Pirellulales bacterium]|nr:DUF423 domain-containing protein [Pirellulales bacterium]